MKQNKLYYISAIILILVGIIFRPLRVEASSPSYYLIDIGTLGQMGQYQTTSVGRTYGYVVMITLKANYNGTITITTNNSIVNQDKIACEGCEIDSLNNTALTVHIYNTNFCMFRYESDNAKLFSYSSNNLTKVSDNLYYPELGSINTKLTNVYNAIDQLEGYASQTNSYLNNTVGYISLIQTETNDINTSVDNMETDVDDIRSTLNSVNSTLISADSTLTSISNSMTTLNNSIVTERQYLQTVLGSIDLTNPVTPIIDNIDNIYNTVSGLAQNVQNLYARVNEINQNVSDIENVLNTVSVQLTSLINSINNIDSLIDTISWYPISYVKFGNYNSGTFTEKTSNGSIDVNEYYGVQIDGNITTYWGNLLYIRLPFIPPTNTITELRYFSYTGGSKLVDPEQYYYVSHRNYTDLYILTDKINLRPNSSPNYFMVKGVNYATVTSAQSMYLGWLYDTDIEYWQLLSYCNEYNYYKKSLNYESVVTSKLDDILTAINNIHINVTQNEITNVTNNFDDDITTIHNVEVNFDNSFGDYNSSLSDSDITLDLSPYSGTFSLLKTNITSLWQSDLISVPILLSCLVFVFLVILG